MGRFEHNKAKPLSLATKHKLKILLPQQSPAPVMSSHTPEVHVAESRGEAPPPGTDKLQGDADESTVYRLPVKSYTISDQLTQCKVSNHKEFHHHIQNYSILSRLQFWQDNPANQTANLPPKIRYCWVFPGVLKSRA